MTISPGGRLVIVLFASLLTSCGGNPSSPTDASNGGAPTMTLHGRIVDDTGAPVHGVTVTLNTMYAGGQSAAQQVFTNANGGFALDVPVRPDRDVDGALLLIERAGFEGTEIWQPAGVHTSITMYPRTMLAAFATVESRIVQDAPYECGLNSQRCRRIQLLPANHMVEVAIVGSAGEQVGLVDDDAPQAFDYASTVTTADGDVFIIGGPASVTLQARYPASADALVGQYSLTLAHDCAEVPEEARTRRYTAAIEPAASGMVVTLSDAQFLSGCSSMDALRLGCHQFLASRDEENVRFDLISGEYDGGNIIERVPSGHWLSVLGSAVGRLEGGNVTATGTGSIWFCTTVQGHPYPCMTATACDNANLKMTFVRR